MHSYPHASGGKRGINGVSGRRSRLSRVLKKGMRQTAKKSRGEVRFSLCARRPWSTLTGVFNLCNRRACTEMTMARSIRPPSASEEHILGEIAYCKARIADIRRAPETSRHREALSQVTERLRRSELLLAQLRSYR